MLEIIGFSFLVGIAIWILLIIIGTGGMVFGLGGDLSDKLFIVLMFILWLWYVYFLWYIAPFSIVITGV